MNKPMKTALITGATDGIGAGLAQALAKKGYCIHITGRNEQRAEQVIARLNQTLPQASHRHYLFDMSSIEENLAFLKNYKLEHPSLDILVLNANSAIKQLRLTQADIEMNFAVGYLSRYMFSIALHELLKKKNGRVMHIGIAGHAQKLRFEKIPQTNYSLARAIAQAYAADTLLAYYFNKKLSADVPHEMHDPAIVNTRQVKEQNILLRVLAKLFAMKEPDEAGEIIAAHISNTQDQDTSGQNFKLGKSAKVSKAVTQDELSFEKLMALSTELTGLPPSEVH